MDKGSRKLVLALSSAFLLLVLLSPMVISTSRASGPTFTKGDVFVDIGGSPTTILWLRPNATSVNLVASLSTGTSGEGDGMAFDASGNLYATVGFAANNIVKFDTSGNLIGTIGSGYNCHPESISFSKNDTMYVGQPDCSTQVLQFPPGVTSGTSPTHTYSVQTENRGSDWVDLASDQCTLYYTSEGTTVFNYNVCTNTQEPPLATGLPGYTAYAHRLLANGDTLVADTNMIVLLNSTGGVIKTYSAGSLNDTAGSPLLFAVNIDPDGTSFWTADYFNGQVFKVDIATGSVLLSFNANTFGSVQFVGGIAVFGEVTQGGPGPSGVPEFGMSSLLVSAAAFAGMAFMLRLRRNTLKL